MSEPRIIIEPASIEGGIAATVHAGAPHLLWMKSEHLTTAQGSDVTAWAMTMLPYAMRKGAPLHLAGSVDEAVLQNFDSIQHLLQSWYPKRLSIVKVTADSTITSTPSGGRGAFFSGGVDSFFTLAKAAPPLDVVIFVGGFDIPIDKPTRIERAAQSVRAAAAEFGATALEVTTNLRTLPEGVTSWGNEQHGAALAAVSYALRAHLGIAHVASSYSDEDLHPWGSHPDLDPLWSSTAQSVLHDSTTELRVEKVAEIMQYESAREGLRVCWMDTDEYNCGSCEKCVRTRVNLRATRHDGECATLPPLLLDEVRSMRLVDSDARIFAVENLRFLRDSNVDDPDLETALEEAIRRGERHGGIIDFVDKVPGARSAYQAAKGLLRR